MLDFATQVLAHADLFLFILLRTSGLVFTSPVFGRRNVPTQVKIGLVAAVTFLFFTGTPKDTVIQYNTLLEFFFLCAAELLLGVALAIVTNMFFSLTYIAGHLIDMQIGFGIVHVYDPQNNTQIPMTGNLLNLLLLVVFFGVNGHHRLIEIIYITLTKIPAGTLTISTSAGMAVLEAFTLSFMLGVMVAVPVLASGIVLEFIFGLLIRSVPQMNMFVIGVPVKIIVGLIMLMFMLPVFINFSNRIFTDMFSSLEKVFATFGAAVFIR